MKPNVKIYIKADGQIVYEANLTALNQEAVKALVQSVDEILDNLATMRFDNGNLVEHVEPPFSGFE